MARNRKGIGKDTAEPENGFNGRKAITQAGEIEAASAANLTFLSVLLQVLYRNIKFKAALETISC
jgi:hypothetical protein